MHVSLPYPLSSPELPGAKQGDRTKCLWTRWRVHRLETIPMHRGSGDCAREKAEASLKRC